MLRLFARSFVLFTAVAAASCSAPPAAPQAPAVLAPNPNLVVQGVPPIPLALVRRVEQYTEFRGHRFADWHPQRAEMLVSHRLPEASTAQLFRLAAAGGELQPLTHGIDPVTRALYEPRDGRYVVFERASGGNEVYRLFRTEAAGAEVPITGEDERCTMLGWLHRRLGQPARLVYSSVPVDRTAAGGTRANIATTLWSVDPLVPEGRLRIAELPGAWFDGFVSPDERTIATVEVVSSTDSRISLVDIASGERRPVLPAAEGEPRSSNVPIGFSGDGRGLFVLSDRAGEFRELMRVDLASGELQGVTAQIPWDVTEGSVSADGALIALQVNVDGRETLRLFDGRTLQERPLPALPAGAQADPHVHPKLPLVAFAVDSAQAPNELHVVDAGSGRERRWTTAFLPPGVDTGAFAEQGIVRWRSFDGRTISGVINRPPARFGGRRPVIVAIHGGPEAQATVGFLGRMNYLVNELGVAVIQPNVRGSSGYGKSFLALDDGRRREDSVKDVGALFDWIAEQPDLDPARVLVMGGSYGGYMTLATSFHYADAIAGSIDVVGISSFVTFLAHTESYRRDLRRAEYGDERDPAMKAFLERISPLNNAERIRKPLFVVQGRNDPRVPYTEAEQIVEKVRANGTPVWYLRAENEGHGFARKENADYQFYATVMFVEQTLLR